MLGNEKARIGLKNDVINLSVSNIIQDGSGGKQLYDSGLKYDSGLYYDRWGSNPHQGDKAKIGRTI